MRIFPEHMTCSALMQGRGFTTETLLRSMCSDCDQRDASAAHLQDADIGNLAVTKINLCPFGGLGSLQLIERPAQEAETLRFTAIKQLKRA